MSIYTIEVVRQDTRVERYLNVKGESPIEAENSLRAEQRKADELELYAATNINTQPVNQTEPIVKPSLVNLRARES